MPRLQHWPLSQDANKSTGVCGTCLAVRQLHNKDGTVHLHGPRNNPCPGSGKLPHSTDIHSSQPAALLTCSVTGHPNHPSLDVLSNPLQNDQEVFCHPQIDFSILKHIPKSARASCCNKLATLLNDVSRPGCDLKAWSSLLNFGSTILRKPERGGKRNNITSIIKKRTTEDTSLSALPLINHDGLHHHRRKPNTSASIASSVTVKVEDGNIKAALRLLCSEDKPATDSEDTYSKLQEKHPLAPSNRSLAPEPRDYPSLQASETEVLRAIRSFPAGSSGGPDGIRPQHIIDLVNCREAGTGLLRAVTGFMNSLLDGHCHPAVQPILFGGNVIALEKKMWRHSTHGNKLHVEADCRKMR